MFHELLTIRIVSLKRNDGRYDSNLNIMEWNDCGANFFEHTQETEINYEGSTKIIINNIIIQKNYLFGFFNVLLNISVSINFMMYNLCVTMSSYRTQSTILRSERNA
ncbi:Uncharacterised protein r2_g2926 [Pycnogonum litorale]